MMKETPRKVHAHAHSSGSETSNRRSKKPHNKAHIPNKASNAYSRSASEEFSEEASRESLDLSAISEISDANRRQHFDEILLLEDESSQTLLLSDMTLSSKDTIDVDESGITSGNRFGSNVLDAGAITSVEAEIVVDFLRKAQTEILSSANAPHHYHKLLDQITKIVMQELCNLPEERDRFAQVLSMKKQVLFFCFLMWIIGVSVVFFFASDDHSYFRGPLPT